MTPFYKEELRKDRYFQATDPFYVEAMGTDRTDEHELETTLDHGYDLIYHDIKEAMHHDQTHHATDPHVEYLEHHIGDFPYTHGLSHSDYEGHHIPPVHYIAPHLNSGEMPDKSSDNFMLHDEPHHNPYHHDNLFSQKQ